MKAPSGLAAAVAAAALLAGCVGPRPKDYAKLVAARPRSILVVPVVNKSVDVNAADYFLSTVPVPLAERGYYVFPVNLVKRLLEDDGLGDPGLVHAADPARLASIFGADAVLYVTIERWDARWALFSTSVTVSATYVLRDGRTGEELWAGHQAAAYDSGSSGGGSGAAGLLVDIVAAAVTKASPNYMPLARKANASALAFPGPGFPAGPYHPMHGQDWAPPEGTAIATPRGPPASPTPAAAAPTSPSPAPATIPAAAPAEIPAAAPAPAAPVPSQAPGR